MVDKQGTLGQAVAEPNIVRTEDDQAFFDAMNRVDAWLKERQKMILLILGAIVAGYFVFKWMQDAQRERTAAATLSFANVRQAYSHYAELLGDKAQTDEKLKTAKEGDKAALLQKQTDLAKQITDTETRLNSALMVLGDYPAPFPSIADLYRVLENRVAGKLSSVVAAADSLKWSSIADVKSAERFYAELTALAVARGLIDDEGSRAKGLEILKNLANSGSVVQVSAILALSNIAATEEQRKEALGVIAAFKTAHPEQAAAVDEAERRLGALAQ